MKLKPPQFDAELVAAIEEHLDMQYSTMVVERIPMDDEPELQVKRALGYYIARRSGNYTRPMLQILPNEAFSGMLPHPRIQCPACYDFSRSWNCPDHTAVRSVVEKIIERAEEPVFGVPAALQQAYERIIANACQPQERNAYAIQVVGRTEDGPQSFTYDTTGE